MGMGERAKKKLNHATQVPNKYVSLGPVQVNGILEVDHDTWHCGHSGIWPCVDQWTSKVFIHVCLASPINNSFSSATTGNLENLS